MSSTPGTSAEFLPASQVGAMMSRIVRPIAAVIEADRSIESFMPLRAPPPLGSASYRPLQRPDGTWRKPVRVKPGFVPKEEQPVCAPRGLPAVIAAQAYVPLKKREMLAQESGPRVVPGDIPTPMDLLREQDRKAEEKKQQQRAKQKAAKVAKAIAKAAAPEPASADEPVRALPAAHRTG